jgi:hypothetical protein
VAAATIGYRLPRPQLPTPILPQPSIVYIIQPSSEVVVSSSPTPVPTVTLPTVTATPEPSAPTIPAKRAGQGGLLPAGPTSVPAPSPPPSNVIVYVTDTSFVGPHVSIALGGSVTWVNLGANVHTATAIGPVRPFDSGGLIHGQAVTETFTVPGTYAYTSAPDCLGGNTSRFSCGDSFTVNVIP